MFMKKPYTNTFYFKFICSKRFSLTSRLGMSKADAIIVDSSIAEKVESIAKDHKSTLIHKIMVENNETDHNNLNKLQDKGWILLKDLIAQNNDMKCTDELDTKSEDILQIYFTSGTTGTPKMVAHTHGSYGYCHWVTGKYWLDLRPTDLHWNISDTG